MKINNVTNLVKRSDGSYDCLLDTDTLGVIPFTVTSNDKETHGQELYKKITEGVYGVIPDFIPPPRDPQEIIVDIQNSVQILLDTEARKIGYDDIKSAITYSEEPSVLKFQNEGKALRAWRSLVWAKCYEILDQWKAGTIPEPTLEEVIAQLPELVI